MPEDIIIYTDGACLGNPGPGGFGAVIVNKGETAEISAGFRHTTNNRMELMAVINALRFIKKTLPGQRIILHTDSRLIVDAMNSGWLFNWKRNGWKKSDKTPVLNQDLWNELSAENNKHKVTYVWVKGHSGIPENELCDRISKEAASAGNLTADLAYEKENSGASGSLFDRPAGDFSVTATKKHTIFEGSIDSDYGKVSILAYDAGENGLEIVLKQGRQEIRLNSGDCESLYNQIAKVR